MFFLSYFFMRKFRFPINVMTVAKKKTISALTKNTMSLEAHLDTSTHICIHKVRDDKKVEKSLSLLRTKKKTLK